MDGFRDTTKTVRLTGGGACRGAAMHDKTMRAFKRGGTVVDPLVNDRNMRESISTRPTVEATQAERAAVSRGNRMQVLEAGEAGVLPRGTRRYPTHRGAPLIGK